MRSFLRLVAGFFILASQQSHSDQYSPFKSQVEGFILAGASQGVTVDMSDFNVIMAERLPGTVVGLCVPQENIVLVNKQYWDTADAIHREALVWHELGHCKLNRIHVTDTAFGHAVSLMYPAINSVDDEEWYKAHRKEYIEELFAPQPPERLFHDTRFGIITN